MPVEQKSQPRRARGFTRAFAGMVPTMRRAELRVDFSRRLFGHEEMLSCGGRQIHIYVHRAEKPGAPVLMEMHGGGFALGSAARTDSFRQALCRVGINVVGLDYRKAPEFPYPAALEDVCRAAEALLGGALELEAGPELYLMGESGGATLAAAAALRLGKRIAGQILHYPMLDMEKPYDEREHFPSDFAPEVLRAFNEMYCPDGVPADPMVSPILADNGALASAPAALIIAAGQDMLKSDAEAYAQRLSAAGTHTEYHEMAGAHHGYIEDWFDPERYAAMTDDAERAKHFDGFGRYAEKAVKITEEFILRPKA